MGVFKGPCPTPKGSENYETKGSSWMPMIVVSLVCLGITSATSLCLIILHLRRYRAPKEQRQIIRMVFCVVVYSVVAFFELFDYSIAQYIDPIGDLYEAFGLCALFLLYIQYAAPSGTSDDETFDAVKAQEENSTNFNWPKISWIMVFQYPLVDILVVIVQEATEATGHYCLNSLKPEFAHLYLELLETVAIGACILAILKFRGYMKRLMKVRRGLSKLACFKGIVFIRFTQQWVFSLLLENHAIKTSSAFSYNDILYGIPSVLTCVEMVLFAAAFWYAFSATEYGSKAKPGLRPMPLWRAALDALNPWDLIVGMARIFPLCGEMRRTGDWSRWRVAQKEGGVAGLMRKGVRKYKGRKREGRYQELDEGREGLTQSTELHHGRTESKQSHDDDGYYSVGGRWDAQDIYRPPTGSPPNDSRTYLMTETSASAGRPRASSQSSLMAEGPTGRPRSSSAGQWNGLRYDRSPWPSSGRFMEEPMHGRDMV